MRVYDYHPATGEFLPAQSDDGGYDAPISPRQKGEYLQPKNSTTAKPPIAGAHQIQVYNGETWDLKDDWRGVAAWKNANGEKLAITEIGIMPDCAYTEIEPPFEMRNPTYDDGAWREKTDLEVYDEAHAADPVACVEQYSALRRAERDNQIRIEQDMIDRHENEVADGDQPTETAATISKRRKRIKALRAVPDQPTFPRSVVWPPASTN